ncbi:MAG TPA: CDP-alcohol phosphatidyltransferase family protein [Bacteroidota bacterium]|nr:CDP-alcohol phosphatidyltransferase family protein [Bacteroidota bacterium]
MSIRQEYLRGLKSIAVEEVFDLIFYRPLAFLLVKGIYNTSITPNQLTLISMLLGIVGGICYVVGTPEAFVAAGIFCILYNIVDCSDGQLARMKHSGTPIGRILDGFADYAVSTAVYVGILIGYAIPAPEPAGLIVLTVAAAAGNTVTAALLDFYRNRYLDITLSRTSVLTKGQDEFAAVYENLRSQPGHWLEKGLIWIYLKYSAVQRGLIGHKDEESRRTYAVDPAVYARENRALMHLWTYLGPTTQWTALVICSFINRIDIFFWWMGVIAPILALVLFMVQKVKDRQLHVQEAA